MTNPDFSTFGAHWCHSIHILRKWVPDALLCGPLSSCVRAVVKQQPGQVFPGGSTPRVCHFPVASSLWKNPSVGCGAITGTISPLSSHLSWPLVIICSVHKLFAFTAAYYRWQNLCAPSLATKFLWMDGREAGEFLPAPVLSVEGYLP